MLSANEITALIADKQLVRLIRNAMQVWAIWNEEQVQWRGEGSTLEQTGSRDTMISLEA